MTRFQKRINIILFYLLLAGAFGATIYFMTRPEMTCTDGIKNQGEEGVDCGGPCVVCEKKLEVEDLKIKSIERADDDQGKEDVVVKIYNPNEEYGAEFFEINIFSESDKNGKKYNSFILPKETKYIIINDYVATEKSEGLSVRINEKMIKWQKIINYQDPTLVIYNDEYKLKTSGKNTYASLIGLLVNEGAVDYEIITIKGILRDARGSLISASSQTINTLLAGQKREFHISFPTKFFSKVSKKEIEVETNIFNLENYLKTRGGINSMDQ